jgi:hypothetical protein
MNVGANTPLINNSGSYLPANQPCSCGPVKLFPHSIGMQKERAGLHPYPFMVLIYLEIPKRIIK